MNGEPKYSEETVEILTRLERLDSKQENMGRKIDEIYTQNGKQWDRIDENKVNVAKLDTKIKMVAGGAAMLVQ